MQSRAQPTINAVSSVLLLVALLLREEEEGQGRAAPALGQQSAGTPEPPRAPSFSLTAPDRQPRRAPPPPQTNNSKDTKQLHCTHVKVARRRGYPHAQAVELLGGDDLAAEARAFGLFWILVERGVGVLVLLWCAVVEGPSASPPAPEPVGSPCAPLVPRRRARHQRRYRLGTSNGAACPPQVCLSKRNNKSITHKPDNTTELRTSRSGRTPGRACRARPPSARAASRSRRRPRR